MYSRSGRSGGQSVATLPGRRKREKSVQNNGADCAVSVIPTELGWLALWGREETVIGLTIGEASSEAAMESFQRRCPTAGWEEYDWNPVLRRMLQEYARGEVVDFTGVAIAHPAMTAFQRDVVEATRRIPYGETRTYSELADEAGYPRAARAVGNVMKNNRAPIIVPCHRVVASGGKWGGFSAPQGVSLKRRMLTMEAEACE